MKVQVAPVIAVACCLQISCATTNDKAAADQPREKGVYVTGSRLPQHTTGGAPVSKYGKEEWEDATRGKPTQGRPNQ